MNLRIPGPIPVPDDILEAMAEPMINHRGPEFKEILYRVTEGLKQVFETENEVWLLTSSGTGAMEAAIVNTLSPGDKVICATAGSFGDRFGEIAGIFGAEGVTLEFLAITGRTYTVQASNDLKQWREVDFIAGDPAAEDAVLQGNISAKDVTKLSVTVPPSEDIAKAKFFKLMVR